MRPHCCLGFDALKMKWKGHATNGVRVRVKI